MEVPAWLLEAAPPPRDMNNEMTAGLGMASPPYISIEDQKFHLIDANNEAQPVGDYDKKIGVYVDVVIVDTNRNTSRIFYKDKFEKGRQTFVPPSCWSDNGVAPSRNSSHPEAPVCATCPKAEWGSKISQVSGKGIPACGTYKKIAVIPLDVPEMLVLMRIPPNSLKGAANRLREYVEMIGKQRLGQRALTVTDVVTRIYFESQGTLNFYPVGFISKELALARKKAWDADATIGIVGRNDEPISESVQRQIAASSPARIAEAGDGSEPQGLVTRPAAAPTSNQGSLSQKAIAQRSEATASPKRGPGRPAKPKEADDGLDIPANLDRRGERDVDAESDNEASEAHASFGIAQNAGKPPADIEGELDNIFGRPPGT